MNCQRGKQRDITRREFIKVTGAIVVVMGVGACGATDESPTPTSTPRPTDTPVPANTPIPTQVL
ncbi:MAG: twin-arginine translocation signal domain-containing protein, partial [Anaerolineae bacterium]